MKRFPYIELVERTEADLFGFRAWNFVDDGAHSGVDAVLPRGRPGEGLAARKILPTRDDEVTGRSRWDALPFVRPYPLTAFLARISPDDGNVLFGGLPPFCLENLNVANNAKNVTFLPSASVTAPPEEEFREIAPSSRCSFRRQRTSADNSVPTRTRDLVGAGYSPMPLPYSPSVVEARHSVIPADIARTSGAGPKLSTGRTSYTFAGTSNESRQNTATVDTSR